MSGAGEARAQGRALPPQNASPKRLSLPKTPLQNTAASPKRLRLPKMPPPPQNSPLFLPPLPRRFCLCETSCPQEDYFPPNLFVKVNGKLCPLPVSKSSSPVGVPWAESCPSLAVMLWGFGV